METRHLPVALAALLGAVGTAPAHATELEPWVQASSPHQTVVGNVGERKARLVAHQFEQLRAVFEEVLQKRLAPGRPFRDPSRPTVILLIGKKTPAFARLVRLYYGGPDTFASALNECQDKRYLLIGDDDRSGHEALGAGTTLFVRTLLAANLPRLPYWLTTGLEAFFGSVEVDERETRWGTLSLGTTRSSLEHRSSGSTSGGIGLSERVSRLVPMKDLLAASAGQDGGSTADIAAFRAQCHALVHMLLFASEANQSPLGEFIRRLRSGAGPEEAAAALGDLEQLQSRLYQHTQRTVGRGLRTPSDLRKADLKVSALAPAAGLAISADYLLQVGSVARAAALARQALEEDPRLGSAHLTLGLVQQMQGRYHDARAHFAEALRLAPESAAAHFLAGALPQVQADETSEAARAQHLRRALELDPRLAAAHALLADLESRRNPPSPAALVEIDAAIVLEPQDDDFLVQRLEVLRRLGRSDETARVEGALTAAARKPARVALVEALVRQFEGNGRRGEAEALLSAARQATPASQWVHLQWAQFQRRNGRFDEAAATLEKILSTNPASAEIMAELASLNAERDVEVPKALSLIERALLVAPDRWEYLQTRGWCLFRLGRLDEAEAALRKTLELWASPYVMDKLAEVLHRKQAREAAARLWQEALDTGIGEVDLRRSRVTPVDLETTEIIRTKLEIAKAAPAM